MLQKVAKKDRRNRKRDACDEIEENEERRRERETSTERGYNEDR